MNLLRDYLKDAENFKDENIRVRFIGDRTPLADDIKELMAKNEYDSRNATGLTLYIAINYGGRDEITHAVREIVDEGIKAEDITEDTISKHLYTRDCPDPDFIIRPSGEYRLSNYLIWQSAYAEYWFSDILWPDFTPKHLEKAIEDFNKRNRRFGGV
jgi:undecaprenyl diphosphate synthase